MRIWLTAATIFAISATGASAQSSVQASATVVSGISAPATRPVIERMRNGALRVVAETPSHKMMLLNSAVVTESVEAPSRSSGVQSRPLEVVRSAEGSTFRPGAAMVETGRAVSPNGVRPVVVTWTVAANS
jgi:hypothetical protein